MKNGEKIVVVPVHKETMPIGTLKSIERQQALNLENYRINLNLKIY